MKYKFEKTEDKENLIGAKIVCAVREETPNKNKGYLLILTTGERVVINAKELYLSRNVKSVENGKS